MFRFGSYFQKVLKKLFFVFEFLFVKQKSCVYMIDFLNNYLENK